MELTSNKQKEDKRKQQYSTKNITGLRRFLINENELETNTPTRYNKLVYDFDITDIYSQARNFIGDSVIIIHDAQNNQKNISLNKSLTRYDNHVGYLFRKGTLKDIRGGLLSFDNSDPVPIIALVDMISLDNIVLLPNKSSLSKFGFEFYHFYDEKSSGYTKINSIDPITAYASINVSTNVDSFFKNYYLLK